jgi:hypothetical protein
MAAPTPNSILESTESLLLGVHAGIPPTLLTRQHAVEAVNVTFRGGKPRTRPVLVKRGLIFINDEQEALATEVRFQGARTYQGFGNRQSCIIAMLGGRMFRFVPGLTTLRVTDVSPQGEQNNPKAPQAFLWQGEEFMIANDGLSLPIFFDGSGSRRSAGPAGKELPVGTVGTYSNGRNVMALPDRQSYIASDLVYSTNSGTPAHTYRDSILKTHDNLNILAGRAFAVPINAGRINAMFNVAVPDTSLGQGHLQIGTRKGVFGTDLPLDATLWTTLQQPTQVVSLPSAGPMGPYSVAIINTDGWYRAKDGLRSFQIGRRDMGTWVQTALSSEVNPILKMDTDFLLDFTSAVEFDNRLLVTCSPYRVPERGTAHRGLIALDFNNISSLTSRSSPDYDGLWTGLQILQIVEGEFGGSDRCFIFALDSDSRICVYELLKDDVGIADNNGIENIETQAWFVTNALFGLDSYPDSIKAPLKKLETADLFLEDLMGEVAVDIKFRSDSWPFWIDWANFSLCATECLPPNCETCAEAQPQFATFMRLEDPTNACSPLTNAMHRTGYYFQLRIQWEGHAAIDKVLTWAHPMKETLPGCPATKACTVIRGPRTNYFDYNIEPLCSLRISAQPNSTIEVADGGTLNVGFTYVGGSGTVTIQWYRNGIALTNGGDISGATSTTLSIANFNEDDVGSYYAIVTDTENPECDAQTDLSTATIPEVPLIDWNDDGDAPPPSCTEENAYLTIHDGSYFTDSWATVSLNDPSINPNTVLTSSDQACAHALYMAELNDYINGTLTPSGIQVIRLVTFWKWYPTNVGFVKQLYNKIAAENCDPFDPTGDWYALSGIGAWVIESHLCVVQN